MTPKEKIFALAVERGSTAKTLAGAVRFLRSHQQLDVFSLSSLHQIARDANAVRQYRNEQFQRRAARIARALGLWDLDEAEQLAHSMTLYPIFNKNDFPYRHSLSPGTWSISLEVGDGTFSHNIAREWGCYSRSCRYPALSEEIILRPTRRAFYYFPKLVVENLVILDAQPLTPREFKMRWLEQGRGLSERAVDGYYIRGRHVTAPDLAAARKKAAKMRKQAARVAIVARIEARAKRLDAAAYRAAVQRIWVTREDSLAAGNCQSATEQFIRTTAEQYSFASCDYALRADFLLSLRDDSFVRRAIEHAMQSAAQRVSS